MSQQPVQTMEQQRAAFALARCEGFLQKEDVSRQAELRRYITQLPALIQINGLGQALAFFHSKGAKSSHEDIYKVLSQWLCKEPQGRVFPNDEEDLLKALTSHDYRCYMAAQNEALALLEWLKKLANALLHKGESS